MKTITVWINKIIAYFCMVLMASIVLDVTWQVVTRFILKNPSSFTEELAGFLLIWIGLLGASHAYYTRAHLGIDIFTCRLTGIKKKIIAVVINSLVILFAFFVMVVGGLRLVNLTLTLNQISPALGIKMGYVYVVLPLSGILIMFYAIGFIVEALKHPTEAGDAGHQVSVLD